VHEESLFSANVYDRNLFRGVAACTIGSRVSSKDQVKLMHMINAMIPDVSPRPFCRENPYNWVCSLGPFAWISVCETGIKRNNEYMVFVVSSLDEGSYAKMFEEMRGMHGKSTIKEAEAKLAFWRDGAMQNRARILAAVKRCLGEPTELNSAEPFPSHGVEYNKQTIEECLEWLSVKSVPLWYAMPDRPVRGCVDNMPHAGYPLGQAMLSAGMQTVIRYPDTVLTKFNVITDNLVRFQETYYARYAACTPQTEETYVCMNGPTDEINVYTEPKSMTGFYANPAQATYTFLDTDPNFKPDDLFQWEDLSANRLVCCKFQQLPIHENYKGRVEWFPVLTRISVVDDLGLVHSKHNDLKRLRGLDSDEYDSIKRSTM
jgi:hypothetical protein